MSTSRISITKGANMARVRLNLKRDQIVDNFVSTMDMDLDMSVHLLNADVDTDL